MKKSYFLSLALTVACCSLRSQTTQLNSVSSVITASHGSSVQSSTSVPSNGKVGHQNSINTVFSNYGWSSKAALPVGRWATGPVFSKNCVASKDTGYIYLIGGSDASFANSALNTVYNTVTGTFSNRAAIPATRTQITPVRVGNKIYVVGGYGASFSSVNTNQIYDIATNTWTTGLVMPVAVGDYACSVYKDSLIYYVGGYNGADVNNVQIYNTYLNTWTTGTTKIGNAVAGCRMGITGNKIVLVGGYSQTLAASLSSAYVGVINTATPSTITWTAVTSYPGGATGRLGSGVAFESNGKVYFGGGDPTGSGTTVLSSINAYNTTNDLWETGPAMPVGVSNIVSLTGIVHNDSLFLVTMGGYNGSSVVTTHNWLNLGPTAPQPTVQGNIAICYGQSTTLTASNALSYTWSPFTALSNATIAAPLASPTVITNYTVTMKKAYGCNVNSVVTVSVNALPLVGVNSTTTQLCLGSSLTLAGTGANSYAWSGGITNNTAFTPTSTVTYTVIGTAPTNCTNSAVTTITVLTLPVVTANVSNTSVCAGHTVTFNGGGASSYIWTNGVINNASFTPVSTSSYTVTGMDASGCINTAAISVTVNALPAVGANISATAVCMGQPVTFNGSGAITYSWTNGVSNNTTYSPTVTNAYSVTGADANGCENTASISVVVNALPTVSASVTHSGVCVGETVIFSASGATSYTWSNGITNNITYTPSTTSTYSVNGTDLNGCSATASISVMVNALPIIAAMASPSTVCSGSTVTLNGSGASTYTWTGGAIDNTSFTPTSSNIYTVTGTDTNGCSNTAFVSVTVNALPVITTSVSETAICNGNTVTLNAYGASSYTWTGGVTDNVAFAPALSANYTVTGTDFNGCSGMTSQSVTVYALPFITVMASPSVICEGQSATLSGQGAVTYTWTNGVINNTPFSPLSTQEYSISGTDLNGCKNSTTFILTVYSIPTIATSGTLPALCSNETITLTATGAVSYTWTNGNTAGNQLIDTPLVTTQYTVSGTNSDGCSSTTTLTQIVSECTSLKEQSNSLTNLLIYPNPSNGMFNINLSAFSENMTLTIFNAQGQLLLNKKVLNTLSSFDLSSYAPGLYIISVSENAKVIAQNKVIKN